MNDSAAHLRILYGMVAIVAAGPVLVFAALLMPSLGILIFGAQLILSVAIILAAFGNIRDLRQPPADVAALPTPPVPSEAASTAPAAKPPATKRTARPAGPGKGKRQPKLSP